MVVVSAGAPCRSLAHQYRSERTLPAEPAQVLTGVELPHRASRWLADDAAWRRRLPTTILWPGVLVNTFLYAAVLAALFLGVGSLRRACRRCCERCITCGYSLAGNTSGVCPECGSSVMPRTSIAIASP